jgi:hypothetical protein
LGDTRFDKRREKKKEKKGSHQISEAQIRKKHITGPRTSKVIRVNTNGRRGAAVQA